MSNSGKREQNRYRAPRKSSPQCRQSHFDGARKVLTLSRFAAILPADERISQILPARDRSAWRSEENREAISRATRDTRKVSLSPLAEKGCAVKKYQVSIASPDGKREYHHIFTDKSEAEAFQKRCEGLNWERYIYAESKMTASVTTIMATHHSECICPICQA